MQKVKEKSNWKGETIVEIEIERLKAFRNHPFQVRDDDDLEKLKESIKMYGILTPLLVRPIKDGTYEIISGHRRKRADALLGYRKIPVLMWNIHNNLPDWNNLSFFRLWQYSIFFLALSAACDYTSAHHNQHSKSFRSEH